MVMIIIIHVNSVNSHKVNIIHDFEQNILPRQIQLCIL